MQGHARVPNLLVTAPLREASMCQCIITIDIAQHALQHQGRAHAARAVAGQKLGCWPSLPPHRIRLCTWALQLHGHQLMVW